MEVRLNLLRSKTAGERMMMAFDLSEFANRMSEAGVRARYPEASEREVFLRAAALRLPRDLMIRAYGWIPTSTPAKAVARLLEVLDRMEVPYEIGGSVASSLQAIPRITLDVDVVVDMKRDQIEDFAAEMAGEFMPMLV